jgi:hypothetical protein
MPCSGLCSMEGVSESGSVPGSCSMKLSCEIWLPSVTTLQGWCRVGSGRIASYLLPAIGGPRGLGALGPEALRAPALGQSSRNGRARILSIRSDCRLIRSFYQGYLLPIQP